MSGLLAELVARERTLRVGVIGAGEFAGMFLAQARRLCGLDLAWVADLDAARAAAAAPGVRVGEDAAALVAQAPVDVVVEATGSPAAGARHALAAIEAGSHVVM